MSRLSVRWRLTLGATVFAAIAIAVALVGGRWAIASEQGQTDAQLVQADLASYVGEIREHTDEPENEAQQRLPSAGALVLVRDSSGETVVDTMPPAVSREVDSHAVGSTFDVRGDGRSWVVASADGHATGGLTVWVARDTTANASTLATVDVLFLAGGLLLVALFAFASWLLVGAALRPIEVMRERERRMVSDAAHELRTPLAGLRGQLELVRAQLGSPAVARAEIVRAEESVVRLGDLASNLLELARLDERTDALHAPVSSMRTAFLAAVDDARLAPDAHGVAIDQSSDLDVRETATVALDGVSFQRLTANLLSNAVRAAGPGGSVDARLSTADSDLVLTVDDNGPGMSDEFRAHALERFTREEAAVRGGGGSGLGLALVDALARSAGGTVDLQNTGTGFRVTVTIPVR